MWVSAATIVMLIAVLFMSKNDPVWIVMTFLTCIMILMVRAHFANNGDYDELDS